MTTRAAARPPESVAADRVAGWGSDLRLGAELVLAAGRPGWLRWGLVAFGLGLCTLVLLLAGSIGPALDSRDARQTAMEPRYLGTATGVDPTDVDRSWFEVHGTTSVYRGEPVQILDLAAVDPTVAAPPPGVDRFPGPGEVVVSPGLAEVLASPDGDGFRPRLGGSAVIGAIAPEGLLDPGELRLYRGSAADLSTWAGYRVADGWGGFLHDGYLPDLRSTSALVGVLLAAGITVVILPLLLFVSLMSRVGSAARDRRDASLRLAGASTRQIRVVDLVETATAALAGLVVGGMAFLLARPAAPFLAVGPAGFFVDDLRPAPPALVAIAVAVPILAIGSVLGGKGPRSDPIGVVRQQAVSRPGRRLWWRLAFPVAGASILTALSLARSGGLALLVMGIVSLLVSAATLLPWVLERLARLLPDGPPAWQLAVGRLRLDPGAPARVVAGLAVVLAGAIALQPLLAAGERLDDDTDVAYQVVLTDVPTSEMTRVAALLRDALGPAAAVRGGSLITGTVVSPAGTGGPPRGSFIDLRLAPCAALGVACTDGMVFAVGDPQNPIDSTASPAGSVLSITVPGIDDGSATFDWTVPEPIATVALPDRYHATLAVTPGALGSRIDGILRSSPARFTVTGVDPSPGTADTLRAELADLGWRAEVHAAGDPADLGIRSILSPTARSGLVIGTLLTLGVAVIGLIVTTVEQLQQRRRPLTLAVAAGVPRGVLTRSIVIGAAIPVVGGVLLAVLSAAVLVTMLGPVLGVAIPIDWSVVALYSAGAVGLVTALAGASAFALPMLTHPAGVRTS